jgi:hypothetical protein
MLRFTTSRAIGLAIALTLGSVATLHAQQDTTHTRRAAPRRSRSQLPVKKEQPPAATPAPAAAAPAETAAMPTRRDTVYVGRADTTVVMCNCAATQAAATGEVLPLIPARIQHFFGNGLSLGLAPGGMLPAGDFMQSYNPGWGINVPLTWDPPHSPIGARINFGYANFHSAAGQLGIANVKQYGANLDAKFRVPFGHFLKATSGAYVVAGAGLHHFTDYNRSVFLTNNLYGTKYTNPALDARTLAAAPSQPSSKTSFGTNAGVGLSLGVAMAELFAEGRYQRVYTPGKAVNYIPIVAGVSFH